MRLPSPRRCLLLALLAGSVGCGVGADTPATPGSPSARVVAGVAEVDGLAREIEAKAIELEEAAAAARNVHDPAERAAAAEEIARRMGEIEALQAELAGKVAEVEGRATPAP